MNALNIHFSSKSEKKENRENYDEEIDQNEWNNSLKLKVGIINKHIVINIIIIILVMFNLTVRLTMITTIITILNFKIKNKWRR
jgi:hypothetical protein